MAASVVRAGAPVNHPSRSVRGLRSRVASRLAWNLIQYHRLAPHNFHLAGILGSIPVLLVLRMTGAERGRRRVYR
jgi:hypothetical protein